jgi:hypothetical protein
LKDYYKAILQKEVNVADLLNTIHHSDKQEVLHTISEFRGGADPFGGITWADYDETSIDLLPGYHQVVGHTRLKKITEVKGEDFSITYIDVLNTIEEFFKTTVG